jgi:iron complex outermembrane recepter protein
VVLIRLLVSMGFGLALLGASHARAGDARAQIEEVIVTGERPKTSTTSGPRSYVDMLDIDAINVTTVEDVIAYEPSVIVRRRFIGDPNGTLGIRGSNQFQTTRSMVFADGLPLHYLLETSFNGAPRWSLVAPDEIVGTEILYGPFSAEYGGNSMGGVVNFETELPAERRFHLEGSGFIQDYDPDHFDALGSQESFGGRRFQGSYGDRFGNLSVYLSHNHLNNESQPLTNRAIAASSTPGTTTQGVPVSGAQIAPDATGADVIYFSDTGPEEVTTNLTKLKLGYSVSDDWLARLTVAYENRKREVEGPENFLRDASGALVFGNDLLFEGRLFNVPSNQFEVAFQDRDTLLIGAGIDGELANGWKLEVDLSRFAIVKDENRRSNGDFGMRAVGTAPFTGAGRLTRFNDTGWITGDLKLRSSTFLGRDDMRLTAGVHYEEYELEIEDFNAANFRTTSGRSLRSRSGGETRTQAAFVQWSWQMTERWDAELGLRYEDFKSKNGFFDNRVGLPAGQMPSDPRQKARSEHAVSPKLSVGFAPNDTWTFRYSIARATRFPVVAELFSNVQSFTSASLANPGLDPEEGLHHNFMIERKLANGYVRTNLYREVIRDVIFNQRVNISGTNSISTFLPIDREVVNGVEMVLSQRGLVNGKVDLQANVEYTRAKIRRNDLDKSIEGNDFPRQPRWRGNLLLTYNWTPRFKTSAGFRYASDSFDQLDNNDREDRVFGAQDAYRFVNLKATYQLTESASFGFGVDNVTNEEAYVFHPWPARTLYAEFAVNF